MRPHGCWLCNDYHFYVAPSDPGGLSAAEVPSHLKTET
eukprot:gene21461-15935_t